MRRQVGDGGRRGSGGSALQAQAAHPQAGGRPADELDVRPSGQTAVREQGQDVVAEGAPGLGGVQLEAEVEVEQALGATPLPDQVVERGEEGRAVGRRSLRAGEGRRQGQGGGRPALDRYRDDFPRVEQVGQGRAAVPQGEPEVVGGFEGGGDAEGGDGPAQQPAGRLPGVRQRRVQPGGQHPLGQIVEPGEAGRAPGAAQLAAGEEHLEGPLGRLPVPPRTPPWARVLERGRAERSFVPDAGQDLAQQDGVLLPVVPVALPVVGHPGQEVAVLGHRQPGGGVAPVLESAAPRVDLVQHLRERAGAEPGGRHQLLAAGDGVDRIQLDRPQPVEHVHRRGARRHDAEPLRPQGDGPGRRRREVRCRWWRTRRRPPGRLRRARRFRRTGGRRRLSGGRDHAGRL